MSGAAGEKYAAHATAERTGRRTEHEAPADVEGETVKVVIFSLHGDLFAFSGETVKELMPPLAVYPVPGAPEFIPGVVNIRGQIESVLDINRFLGLPDGRSAAKSRIAVAEKDGTRSGILVDSVVDVTDVPAHSIKPPLGTLSPGIREFVSGEFFLGDKLVILLDVGRIFGKIAV